MRISTFLLFFCSIVMFAENSHSQNARVTIKQRNVRLVTVLDEIENQTDYLFLYDGNQIDMNQSVSVNVKNMQVNHLLSQLFSDSQVHYAMEGTHIVLMPDKKVLPPDVVSLQQITITGVVTDAEGETLPGVSVRVMGTTQGTATDINGAYSLQVKDENATLVFSFVGFSTQEFSVGNQRIINVTMHEEMTGLDEIVVIGYGTARRADLTGSVASVSAAQFKDVPLASTAMLFTGKMAGVNVTQTEGSLDAEIKIRVRGGGSITQDNSPLYIIDGFPVDNLGAISPADIATIDVLKDASSTAIYGARGANGVVIITTKSGYEGKATISFNSYYGNSKVPKFLDVLDGYEYALWQYEISGPGTTIEQFLGRFEDYHIYRDVENTNWQKRVLGRTGTTLNNNISITGGSKAFTYNVSFTRDDRKDVMVGQEALRNNVTSKVNYTVKDWLSLEVGLRLSDQVNMGSGTSRSGRLQHILNYRPIMGIQGIVDPEDEGDYETISSLTMDPYKQTMDDYRRNVQHDFDYNTAVNIKLPKDIVYRFQYSTRYGKQSINIFYGLYTSNAQENGSQPLAEKDKYDRRSWQITNTLSYNKKDFLQGHNISAMIGQEMNSSSYERMRGSVKFLPKYIDAEGGLAMMNLGVADPVYTFNNSPNNNSSFFGRVMYDYKGKYLLSATVRADGSSKFAPGNRWGVFPSFGAYWRISDENFMEGTKSWLSDLKLRASYGQAGNNRIADDLWRKALSINTSRLFMDGPLGAPTAYIQPSSTLANPKLKWETTITRNVGLDFYLFKSRVSGTVELYLNTTRDLLISASIPANTGYSTQMKNIGQTSNRGIEVSFNANIIEKRDFSLSANFNIGFNKNRIDKLGETKRWTQDSGWGGADGSTAEFLIYEGGQVGIIYGYETDGNGIYSMDDFTYNGAEGVPDASRYTIKPGVANNSGLTGQRYFRPGCLKFKKQNIPTDPNELANLPNSWWNITTDDKIEIGNANPKHVGGFGLDARFKGFDFSAAFNWSYGNDIFNVNKLCATAQFGGRRYKNILGMMDSESRWMYYHPETGLLMNTPEDLVKYNGDKKYWYATQNRSPLHSWAIEDGSFLRLNTLSIGYSVPKTWLSRVHLEQLRLYASGFNLWLWTNYSGYDPEVDGIRSTPLTPGCDWNSYPKPRSFNVGINLTL